MSMFIAAITVAASFWGTAPCTLTATEHGVVGSAAQCSVHVHVANLPNDVPIVVSTQEPRTIIRGDVLGRFIGSPGGFPTVEIDARYWRWRTICATMMHEFGHAEGLGHSANPRDRMYPLVLTRDPFCVGKRPPEYPPGAVVRLRATD